MPRGQACDANRNKQTNHDKAEQTTAFWYLDKAKSV